MGETNWYIKDDNVAVLISPSFGAGWSTWMFPSSAYDRRIIEKWLDLQQSQELGLIDKFEAEHDMESFLDKLNAGPVYTGGFWNLEIHWVPLGQKFFIYEYDGHESLITEEDMVIAGA